MGGMDLREEAVTLLQEFEASDDKKIHFVQSFSGRADPVALLRDIVEASDDFLGERERSDIRAIERVVFGRGYTADQVADATEELQAQYRNRATESDLTALRSAIQTYRASASFRAPAPVVVPTPRLSRDRTDRRWFLPIVGFLFGAVATTVFLQLAGPDDATAPEESVGAGISPQNLGSFTTNETRPKNAATRDESAQDGALKWFDALQSPADALPLVVEGINPTTSHFVGAAGLSRVWVARDFEGGYCVVTMGLEDDSDAESTCVTPGDFEESGNNVLADRVLIEWDGSYVNLQPAPLEGDASFEQRGR